MKILRSACGAALVAALLSGPARAEQDAERWLSFRGRVDWISAGQGTLPRENKVNPHDAVLRIPQVTAQTELRPDLRLEARDLLVLVARPRLLLEATRSRVGVYRPVTSTSPLGTEVVTGFRVSDAWQPVERHASVTWIDLFATLRPWSWISVTYGLQNYQWGPAEALSPSNRIFHETGFTRDLLYVLRGKNLVRVNLSAGQAFTAVLLAEVRDNGDESFVGGAPFREKAAGKLEWAARSGRAYLGVTGGGQKIRRGRLAADTIGRRYVGEYGAVQATDGLSIYADAVHQAGAEPWVPIEQPGGVPVFAHRFHALSTLAVGGVRYTFTDGTDFRIEYVFDERGWDRRQLELAYLAAAATQPPSADRAAAALAWQRPGFEILGRQAVYASMSFVDLPPWKRTKLKLRFLKALEDNSMAGFATLTYDATGWLVLFASAEGTDGSRHASLARAIRGMVVGGFTASF